MDSPAIAIRDLTRRFGTFTAVDNVTLNVAAGQFFGFLGPNGAGKSTTIKMMTGLLAPTSGHIELLGLDFATHPLEIKRQIASSPKASRSSAASRLPNTCASLAACMASIAKRRTAAPKNSSTS
jgi:ABC-type multidrug transport system ATPase subunit